MIGSWYHWTCTVSSMKLLTSKHRTSPTDQQVTQSSVQDYSTRGIQKAVLPERYLAQEVELARTCLLFLELQCAMVYRLVKQWFALFSAQNVEVHQTAISYWDFNTWKWNSHQNSTVIIGNLWWRNCGLSNEHQFIRKSTDSGGNLNLNDRLQSGRSITATHSLNRQKVKKLIKKINAFLEQSKWKS